MGLKKLAKKVADYNERLELGKASKIKPDHVNKVLSKLQRKAADLEAEMSSAPSQEKSARLERKLNIAREQIDRARWLLKEISASSK